MDKKTLADTSIAGPALTPFRGSLAMAWTGTDGAGRLNVATGLEFDDFTKVTLDEFSITRPALATFNGRLYLAWVGTDGGDLLNLASSADGVTFDQKVTLNERSAFGPSLRADFGRLYLAWTGTDGENHLNLAQSRDGRSLENKITYGETLTGGPALTTNETSGGEELVFIAWTGTDNPHHINFAQGFSPGFENSYVKYVYDGSTEGIGPDASTTGPALVYNPGQFATFLSYIGNGGDGRLFVLGSGENTEPPDFRRMLNESSIDTPALAAAPGIGTWLAWTGTDGQGHLNLAQV